MTDDTEKRLEDSQNRNIDLLLCINNALGIIRNHQNNLPVQTAPSASRFFEILKRIENALTGKI